MGIRTGDVPNLIRVVVVVVAGETAAMRRVATRTCLDSILFYFEKKRVIMHLKEHLLFCFSSFKNQGRGNDIQLLLVDLKLPELSRAFEAPAAPSVRPLSVRADLFRR